LAIRFGVILRKVWGGSRTWAGARAQAVLMSVWRACWRQGRCARDFLGQLLPGRPGPWPRPLTRQANSPRANSMSPAPIPLIRRANQLPSHLGSTGEWFSAAGFGGRPGV
jgi:transposase